MGRGAVLATNAFLKNKQVGSGGAVNVEGWVEFSGRWEGKRPAADHNFLVHIKANPDLRDPAASVGSDLR